MSDLLNMSKEDLENLLASPEAPPQPSNTISDSASTSEVIDTSPRSYGFFGNEEPPVFEDSAWSMTEAKALGLDVGGPLVTGVAASPLLFLGPKGWIAYGLIQGASGYGFNTLAQKVRNPNEDVDEGERIASAAVSLIPGVGSSILKSAGPKTIMLVRGAEGATMGASESLIRQGIQIADEDNPREELDWFDVGFASSFGFGFGGAMGKVEASGMLNRAGVSTSDAKKIQDRTESEVARRINRLEMNIKTQEQKGNAEYANQLRKERDDLKSSLELISKSDAEYLQNIRKQGVEKKQEIVKLKEQLDAATAPPAKKDVVDDAPTQPEVTGFKTQGDPFEVGDLSDDIDFLKKGGKLTLMSPDEYIDMAMKADPKRSRKDIVDERLEDVEGMARNKEAIQNDAAPPLSIYRMADGTYEQEGLKRALAAKELGLTKVPVIVDASKFKADAPTPPKTPAKEQPEAPAPKASPKLTKEQKLQALERMGMTDDDLADLVAGKTDVLPVNLGAFTTDTDIQRTMASVLEQVADGFKKRRVKTDKKALIKQAAALRSKLDPSIDELAYAKQIASESEDIIFKTVVADSMTFKAFQDWNTKMGNTLDFNDPKVLNDLMVDLERLGEFAEASATISSSAGKLLQSRKVSNNKATVAAILSSVEKQAVKAEKQMSEELLKYSKDLNPKQLKEQLEKLGGLKSARGFAAELRLMRDTGKLGQLLEITRKSKLRKFADAYMELRYDMILSAPTTQAAAASGNFLMGVYSLLNQGVGGLASGNLASTRMALRTSKNLFMAMPEAYKAAKLAAKHSQGQMALTTHYEKVGGKALSMEATGLNNPIGETIENLGELAAFGPKGLVFQDEFYRHMFAKAQARSLIAEEYHQLVKSGKAPAGKINDYIEGKLSGYFVDGQRLKTRQDVQLEAIQKANEQGLNADEAAIFIKKYTDENWTEKLSSELEYIKDVGDRVTFQQQLSSEFGSFEAAGAKISEFRQREGLGGFLTQYMLPFIKTPVNIFKEAGGTLSATADIPVIGKLWRRSRAEFESPNPHIRAQARGRQIVGAGLWSTALYLAHEGLVTGSGPRDYKELQSKKNTGWQPNSLNVSAMERLWATGDSGGDQNGDNYVSLQRLDPLATITGLAADLLRAHEDNELGEDGEFIAQTIMLAVTEQVSQKSYLKTVGDALDSISNGKKLEDIENRVLKELVRGNTPAILGNMARSEDPYVRDVESPLELLRQRLLLDSRSLDPRRDIFGKEVAYNRRALTREWNAVGFATASKREMDEATRITDELRITSYFPKSDSIVPGLDLKEIKVAGSKQSLYDRLQELYSKTNVKKDVIEVYEDPSLSKATKPLRGSPFKNYQKNAVMSVMSAYRNLALGQLLEEYPELEKQYEYMGKITEQQLEGKELPKDKDLVAPELRQLLNQ